MRGWAIAVSMVLLGCSSSEPAAPPASSPPPDGGTEPAGPGLLPWTCQPGEVAEADGSCTPAGIGPERCGNGFEHDGGDSCDPILPSSACGPGQMAVPGETACRSVAPCGSGKWGDIEVGPTTVYVDAAHTGTSDGSAASPFATIAEAILAADAGATIAIAAGVYAEALSLSKPVVLWGKCPGEVEIASPPMGLAIEIEPAADGAVVRSVAVTGDAGIEVFGAQDVLLDRIWVHDTIGGGIFAGTHGATPSSVAVEGSLVEATHSFGVLGVGSHVTVSSSVVRDVQADSMGAFGSGVEVSLGDNADAASLKLEASLVERARSGGVIGWSVPVEIVDTVVRDVEPLPTVGGAPCIYALVQDGAAPPAFQIATSVLERCNGFGVYGVGGHVAMDRVVVRDVTAAPMGGALWLVDGPVTCDLSHSVFSGLTGIGFYFRGQSCDMTGLVVRDVASAIDDETYLQAAIAVQVSGLPSGPDATIRGARIEDVTFRGLALRGAHATIETTLVTAVSTVAGYGGVGIVAESNLDVSSGPRVPSTITLRDSNVESVPGIGIDIIESSAEVVSTRFADFTDPSEASLSHAVGLISSALEVPATATFTHCLVERVQGLGVVLAGGASLTLDHTIVREVTPDATLGFGDGLCLMTITDYGWARATVVDSVIASAARAAISNFGGEVAISRTSFDCNPIDLDGEEFHIANLQGDVAEVPSVYEFDDGGDNVCGCGEQSWPCQVETEGLSAPIPPSAEQ